MLFRSNPCQLNKHHSLLVPTSNTAWSVCVCVCLPVSVCLCCVRETERGRERQRKRERERWAEEVSSPQEGPDQISSPPLSRPSVSSLNNSASYFSPPIFSLALSFLSLYPIQSSFLFSPAFSSPLPFLILSPTSPLF